MKPHIPENDSEFSLEKPREPQQMLTPNSRIVSFFRIITWLAPGPAVLVASIAYSWAFVMLDVNQNASYYWILWLIMALTITFGIGYCNAFVSDSVTKKDGMPLKEPAIHHAFEFTMIQIVVAPLVVVMLGLGMCSVYALAA